MNTPTKARSAGSLRVLLALSVAVLLGACAGESTGPSTLTPSDRNNTGYVVAERVGVDTAAVLATVSTVVTRNGSKKP